MAQLDGQLIDVLGYMESRRPYVERLVHIAKPAQWQALLHNYAVIREMINAGLDTWDTVDWHDVAEWTHVFTPIERAVWEDLRYLGMRAMPQFPVGRRFVDFAFPVSRIAVECDGKNWHDARRDAARDEELAGEGWCVVRIPGWSCKLGEDVRDDRGQSSFHTLRDLREYMRISVSNGSLRAFLQERADARRFQERQE